MVARFRPTRMMRWTHGSLSESRVLLGVFRSFPSTVEVDWDSWCLRCVRQYWKTKIPRDDEPPKFADCLKHRSTQQVQQWKPRHCAGSQGQGPLIKDLLAYSLLKSKTQFSVRNSRTERSRRFVKGTPTTLFYSDYFVSYTTHLFIHSYPICWKIWHSFIQSSIHIIIAKNRPLNVALLRTALMCVLLRVEDSTLVSCPDPEVLKFSLIWMNARWRGLL